MLLFAFALAAFIESSLLAFFLFQLVCCLHLCFFSGLSFLQKTYFKETCHEPPLSHPMIPHFVITLTHSLFFSLLPILINPRGLYFYHYLQHNSRQRTINYETFFIPMTKNKSSVHGFLRFKDFQACENHQFCNEQYQHLCICLHAFSVSDTTNLS